MQDRPLLSVLLIAGGLVALGLAAGLYTKYAQQPAPPTAPPSPPPPVVVQKPTPPQQQAPVVDAGVVVVQEKPEPLSFEPLPQDDLGCKELPPTCGGAACPAFDAAALEQGAKLEPAARAERLRAWLCDSREQVLAAARAASPAACAFPLEAALDEAPCTDDAADEAWETQSSERLLVRLGRYIGDLGTRIVPEKEWQDFVVLLREVDVTRLPRLLHSPRGTLNAIAAADLRARFPTAGKVEEKPIATLTLPEGKGAVANLCEANGDKLRRGLFWVQPKGVAQLVADEVPAEEKCFELVDAADFNRDADYELLWRRQADGEMVLEMFSLGQVVLDRGKGELDPCAETDACADPVTDDEAASDDAESGDVEADNSETPAETPAPAPAPAPSGNCAAAAADAPPLHRALTDDFPATATRIDFESDGDGRPLNVGDNVQYAFATRGVRFFTSISQSYVAVDAYAVSGRSRRNSAATKQPRWEGTLTLRFHQPRQPAVPAAVREFGLYIADVRPGGTSLEPFDAQGNALGRIDTRCSGTDFLGFRSDVPVAGVRVVPNPRIDPNYTIDDLVFDAPR